MKHSDKQKATTKQAPSFWSLSSIVSIGIFAGSATYIFAAAYAEQATPATTTGAPQPSLLPVWAIVLAISLPIVILLPVSIIRKRRERDALLLKSHGEHLSVPLHLDTPKLKLPKRQPRPKPKPVPAVERTEALQIVNAAAVNAPVVPAKPRPASPATVVKPQPAPPTVKPQPEPAAAALQHAKVIAPTTPQPLFPANVLKQAGGIPPNSLHIGESLKDMVIRSMREDAAKRRKASGK